MSKTNKSKYINKEEKKIIDSVENGKWESVKDIEVFTEQAVSVARATLRKDKRMNIRISERDLKNLKVKALEEGIPYQTLVSMILHKYVTGRLKETA